MHAIEGNGVSTIKDHSKPNAAMDKSLDNLEATYVSPGNDETDKRMQRRCFRTDCAIWRRCRLSMIGVLEQGDVAVIDISDGYERELRCQGLKRKVFDWIRRRRI